MEISQLKYVVGEALEGQPAIIRLYGYINQDRTSRFIDEFLWLQDCVKPSKIIVSINSEGGSVLHGMGVFATIQNCPIEVETVIEGIAASMASVIWAAGTRSYMRDYSILMIHNPFVKGADTNDPDMVQTVDAFRKQIETVYRKRFGLSKDKVTAIMEGKEGCDGTYLDAKQAVAAGIIPANHVLKTSKQMCDKVKNQLEGLNEVGEIQKTMAAVASEVNEFKLLDSLSSIPKQNQIENSKPITMEEKEKDFAFGTVCNKLGMAEDSKVLNVTERISALLDTETKLTETENALNEMKIQKEGLEAQLTNVNNELASVKNALKVYQDAEKAQHDAEIAQFVDNAIADGKIAEDAKDKWVEMAQSNFEMVQATLNSIAPREKISEEIAKDPANVEAAATAMTDAEKLMAQAVEDAVGKDFQFKKLED